MLLSGSTMAAETLDSFGNISKAELLREIIAEKLTIAAQEILAVVERTVAGYEEEASGFRQEIDRQRRQLELLLQPQVKEEEETTDDQQLFPVCEEAAGGEQYKYEPSLEDGGSLGLLVCHTEEQMDEAALSFTQDQDHLTPLHYETASRSVSPSVQSDRRSAGRRRISEPLDHVDLRIRILEDSTISVLSTNVFQKYPLQELQCPLGLQESDFLQLLRSTFPQLAADEPFDIFTTDHSRKLQPLRVETLTPEQIYSSIKSTGHSALYIRLKAQEEQPVRNEELHLQREDAAEKDSLSKSTMITANNQTKLHTRLLSPTARSDRKKRSKRRTSEPPDHVDLRICILEDSQISVLSSSVFQKYPLQELQCPLGLQESDFLQLLRSTFPQLPADEPFDVFTTDRSRKLQPLRVETLTPEQIYSSIKSTGHSAFYIRLKKHKELHSVDEELQPSQRKDAADSQTSQTRLLSPRVQSERRRTSEPENHVALRICILENFKICVLSTSVFQKYPLQELQCPLGLQESDFLQLLRSTFPQLPADEPFDVFTCDKNKRLQPLTVKTLTPLEIVSSIRSMGAGYSALYIRLKPEKDAAAQHSPTTADENKQFTRSVSPSVQSDRKSAIKRRISEPQDHVNLRIRILEDSTVTVLSTHVFQKYPLQELQCPLGLQESDFLQLLRSTFPQLPADEPFDVFTTDRSRKLQPLRVETLTPEQIYSSIKSTGHSAFYIRLKEQEETHLLIPAKTKRRTKRSGVKKASIEEGGALLSCKVCKVPRWSMNMLIKHAWSHVDEPENICGVCGEHSESADELRTHLQSHQKTHSCSICGMYFISASGLSGHMARHIREKTYECKICHKEFFQKSVLKNHRWVHMEEKPHKCDLCEKSFVSSFDLKVHKTKHTGEKLFRCSECNKSLRTFDSLSQHMRGHSGYVVQEKTYECEVCGRRFHTKHQHHAHMKHHFREKPYACSKCNKLFHARVSLETHMRVHTGEKPYKCPKCDMSFSQSHCVKRHMKTHLMEENWMKD